MANAKPSPPASGSDAGQGPGLAEVNERISYHSGISAAMTAERTSLESGLIPVTAYILVSAAECFFRHPEMAELIDRAMPAEEIGAAARRPGCRVNAVHLWSAANIYLTGRKFIALVPGVADDPARTATLLDFWERAARAFHGGHRQAWDTGMKLTPYDDATIATLSGGAGPITGDDERSAIKRLNATLMSYLFLQYFDTRVGTGDTGPYPLDGGRVLLVRDFYRIGPTEEFWWTDDLEAMPYHDLTAALVLDGVDLRVNDWGTSLTDPEDYLDHLVGFGLFTTDDGSLTPVDAADHDRILGAARTAQSSLYRRIAVMDRHEKIRCGASVYFGFLRPFAELAGVAGELDWSVPRDSVGPLYDMLASIGGSGGGDAGAGAVGDGPYYAPYEEPATAPG